MSKDDVLELLRWLLTGWQLVRLLLDRKRETTSTRTVAKRKGRSRQSEDKSQGRKPGDLRVRGFTLLTLQILVEIGTACKKFRIVIIF